MHISDMKDLAEVENKKKNSKVIAFYKECEKFLPKIYRSAVEVGGLENLDEYDLTFLLRVWVGKILNDAPLEKYEEITDSVLDILFDEDILIDINKCRENNIPALIRALRQINDIYQKGCKEQWILMQKKEED